MEIILGNSLEKLKELEDNSIDSIVTDPPYELGFMGKKWDNTGIANNVDLWAECLRVLKPGGHLLAFSGTRTYHRMAVAIEDAGFEVRDMIEWVYGSGFPKSLNIGKAVDKLQGNEREVVGKNPNFRENSGNNNFTKEGTFATTEGMKVSTKGTSKWEGWGTALKPAHEPICMARKPLAEKNVAQNVLKWGTGGINVDESRVGQREKEQFTGKKEGSVNAYGDYFYEKSETPLPPGRFPANLIHDNSDEVRECFPETKSGAMSGTYKNTMMKGKPGIRDGKEIYLHQEANSGNASRFFKSIIYNPKASKAERNKGLDSTLTVKYNNSISLNKEICKKENTVAVQLLQRVISEQELVSFNIDESGVNIMVQCHRDSLSTTLTTINKTIESKILNLLMLSLTNEYTQVANSETETGGNLVENVESLRKWILTITKGKTELALGANNVALQTLLKIKEEENWSQKTNIHSTVKPIALMEYLIKMVTPKGGTVLDPFMGSGSTGVAAKKNGYDFIGIDMTPEYIEIAKARINATEIENRLI